MIAFVDYPFVALYAISFYCIEKYFGSDVVGGALRLVLIHCGAYMIAFFVAPFLTQRRKDFAGKTALITGASRGIGKEIAKRLALKEKMNVILVARNQKDLNATKREIHETCGDENDINVHVIAMDLAAAAAGAALFERVRDAVADGECDNVTVLVNNAGLGDLNTLVHTSVESVTQQLRVMVESLTLATRLFVPPMLAARCGALLNVGSSAGFLPGPNMAVYWASKAFVNSLSEALWFELAAASGARVTCTVAALGPVRSDFARASGNGASVLFATPTESARSAANRAVDAMLRGQRMLQPAMPTVFFDFVVRPLPSLAKLCSARFINLKIK